MTQVLDPNLWADTMGTGFGLWTQIRLYLFLALAVMLWPRGALESRNLRWAAAAGVVATAVTFSGTGHAATNGSVWAHAVDSAHVVLAGGWVGGLILLAVTATDRESRPGLGALAAFSRFALLSVAGLLVTGILNSLLRLEAVSALWDSTYGRLLLLKVAVLGVALAAAVGARARVRTGAAPRDNSIRVEVVSTVVVLAVTAVLASTAPPATLPAQAATSAASQGRTTVEMSLGDGRSALLDIDPPTTRGSRLRLEVLDADGQPLDAAGAKLQAALPERDLGPLQVRLTGGPSTWTGTFTFPLSGEWKLTLTVTRQGTGIVTAGTVRIGQP
jgi:copper transport protein